MSDRAGLIPLFRELGNLKRITSAGRNGSIATRMFLAGWGALMAGEEPREVGRRTVGAALAAARLGDLDLAKLFELGLSRDEAEQVLRTAFETVDGAIDPALASELQAVLAEELPVGAPPAFALLLADQPRAGVTCPGKPRLMLEPAENHAEHCLAVAVYGVLLAPGYGADRTAVFLAGLGHHFHNAYMPDSGFTGEVLLGDLLDPVIARGRERALSELPPSLRSRMEAALALIADDASPEGRAFHAADVIDRVLEIEQHLTAAGATMDAVLGDYELVHAGPVKAFQDSTLQEVGLL
ncbi:hypothetical protein [uncultured Sphingomonas sp.]|uniref:hypothetical protein n=1 Tax=uncultured Sphingomonas sp. TaxID=158754 RepID=UPI0025D6D96C|nr:hypothetical protein [uncultured Sphingomonas sp.]